MDINAHNFYQLWMLAVSTQISGDLGLSTLFIALVVWFIDCP